MKSSQWLKADHDCPCPRCDKVRMTCRHCECCRECCRCPNVCQCGEMDCDVHELCAGWPAKGCLGVVDRDDGNYYPNPRGGCDLMFCNKCYKKRAAVGGK